MQSQDKLPGITNYLMGSGRAKGPTNLPTYAKTRAECLPGIDLVYYGPRANSNTTSFWLRGQTLKIRLKFAGAKPVVDASGDLVLALGGKEGPRHPVPQAGPLSAGRRHRPACERQVHRRRRHDEVRFQVGPYDHGRELVIDPELVYPATWAAPRSNR